MAEILGCATPQVNEGLDARRGRRGRASLKHLGQTGLRVGDTAILSVRPACRQSYCRLRNRHMARRAQCDSFLRFIGKVYSQSESANLTATKNSGPGT